MIQSQFSYLDWPDSVKVFVKAEDIVLTQIDRIHDGRSERPSNSWKTNDICHYAKSEATHRPEPNYTRRARDFA